MSCESINQQAIALNVSLGSLPEGFCPSSMQELAQAIAERLIITPTQNSSSFAIGPLAPTSNVGPWLKDCEEWFVWDDNLAVYVPIARGFINEQFITTSGNFVVPASTYKIRATAWGGGGGGSNAAGTGGSGGGGGAFGRQIFAVVPGQAIALTVGVGGAAGAAGTNGGDTTILTLVAGGGKGATAGTQGGQGGTATGGIMNFSGQAGRSSSDNYGGGGGDSPQGGSGGVYDLAGTAAAIAGGFPGGGGVGGTNSGHASAAGAAGGILIEY